MRVRLVIAPLLFFLPTNICSSKEDQRTPLEIEKLFYNDDVGVIDIDPNKTRGPAAGEKTEVRRKVTELTDDNGYTSCLHHEGLQITGAGDLEYLELIIPH